MTSAKKTAYCAMLTALAMILNYIEALIPFSIGVPGVKIGLSNIVTVAGIYFLPPGWVFMALILKVTLVSFLFGNMSMLIYSMAGGILSFLTMTAVKRFKCFSMVGVSIAGGVSHNIGQLIVAALAVESAAPFLYLPVLLATGAAAGVVVGVAGERVYKGFTYFK